MIEQIIDSAISNVTHGTIENGHQILSNLAITPKQRLLFIMFCMIFGAVLGIKIGRYIKKHKNKWF